MSNIKYLCNKYTNLTDVDISILENFEKSINTISQLVRADIFIDCLTKDKNRAIVVAQSFFDNSLYSNSVVGEFAYRYDEPAVLRALELDVYVKEFKGLSQEKILIHQTVAPIKNGEKVIGVLIMEVSSKQESKNSNLIQDVIVLSEDYINIEDNLTKSNEDKNFIEYVAEGIVIFNSNNEVVYANQRAIEIYKNLGYINNILNLKYDDITFHKLNKNMFYKGLTEEYDIEVGKLSLNVKYIKADKHKSQLTMIIKDVTETKQKDQELIVKSVAINEMNHRIKNNLQTIISLLNLQARRFDNKEVFLDCINRINSIAIIHELITDTKTHKVNLKLLCKNLIEVFRYNLEQEIKFEVSGDSPNVNGDIATAVSMVITEALQNASKYAFKNRECGLIKIIINENDVLIKVTIKDNGVGFNMKEVRDKSLGISIMRGIVSEKIKGTLNIKTDDSGTVLEFDILK